MGKIVLIYVLFLIVANATLDMVNKENTSRLLSGLSVMCSSLIVILIIFITITVVITKKVLLTVAYKLQNLYPTYRQMMHATSKLKVVRVLLLIFIFKLFREFELDKIHINNVIQQYISLT